MSDAIGEHFEKMIQTLVSAGRYENTEDVLREGLRLVEERESRFIALKQHIDDAVDRGGSNSAADVRSTLAADDIPS